MPTAAATDHKPGFRYCNAVCDNIPAVLRRFCDASLALPRPVRRADVGYAVLIHISPRGHLRERGIAARLTPFAFRSVNGRADICRCPPPCRGDPIPSALRVRVWLRALHADATVVWVAHMAPSVYLRTRATIHAYLHCYAPGPSPFLLPPSRLNAMCGFRTYLPYGSHLAAGTGRRHFGNAG